MRYADLLDESIAASSTTYGRDHAIFSNDDWNVIFTELMNDLLSSKHRWQAALAVTAYATAAVMRDRGRARVEAVPTTQPDELEEK